MTQKETAKRFCMDERKLRYYVQNGLLDCHKQSDGSIDYCDGTLETIGLIEILRSTGIAMDTLKNYLSSQGNDTFSHEARIRILRQQRYALLDEIHGKQKILDQLDYLIYETEKIK